MSIRRIGQGLLRSVFFMSGLLIIAGMIPGKTWAGDIKLAPLSPSYLQYLKAKDAALAEGRQMVRVTKEGHGLGYIPDRIDRSYLREQTLQAETAAAAAFPATYDLRTLNKVTPIRDQNYCGSCWAFASFASLETHLMPARQTDWSGSSI